MLLSREMILDFRLLSFFKFKRKSKLFIKPILKQRRNFTTITGSEDNNANKLKILFFGTDNFSLPSLQQLHLNIFLADQTALGAVTSFKTPANCVRLYAKEHKIPLYRWPIEPEICQKYDLGVVVSFGHLIPERIIKSFPLGMINVHASLLPRWRGAAPIIYAIMNGDKSTGVSIMRIEPNHFDVGDILAQESVAIGSNILMPELHERLANDGASLLTKVICGYPNSFQNVVKQNKAEVTLAPKVTFGVTQLNWSTMTATDVYNRYRALYSYKNVVTKFHGKNVHLIEIQQTDKTAALNDETQRTSLVPGSFSYMRDKKCLRILCANNTYVDVLQLRMEFKKVMSAMEFNNGFLKKLSPNELIFS